MTEFKAYRHAGCIIYTGKNKAFLEEIAEHLKTLPYKIKQDLNEKTVNYGGLKYQIVITAPEGLVTLVTVPQSKKNSPKIVLSEDYR
jgi:hypothetical protein